MKNKSLIGIFAYSLIASANNITAGIVAYMMMTYSEVSPTSVAMVMTIPAITGTIFAFISGNIINKFGTRKVALGLEILEILSGSIYFLFGNKTSVYVLWLAAALYGFLMGGNGVLLGQLFLENVEDDYTRSACLGYSNAIMSLGGVFFASVGGYIASIDNGANWQRAYLLYLLIIISFILDYIFLPKNNTLSEVKNQEKQKSKLPLKVYLLSLHYGLYFMLLYIFSLNVSEYVIVTHQLGTSAQAGNAISFITVGGILAGLTFRIFSQYLQNKTMPVLFGLTALGLLMIYFIHNIVVLYIAAFIIGFAMMGTGPYIMAKLSRVVRGDAYPKALSIQSGLTNVGMLVSLYVFAYLANFFFKDPNNVDGKILIAAIGTFLLAFIAIPLYQNKD